MRVKQGSKYREITEALVRTGGFCPCVAPYAWKDEDGNDVQEWKCMCKEFIDQKELGECRCGRFTKEREDG